MLIINMTAEGLKTAAARTECWSGGNVLVNYREPHRFVGLLNYI